MVMKRGMKMTSRSEKDWFSVTQDYQHPKPKASVGTRHIDDSGFGGDPRFRDYADALKRGDIDKCKEICFDCRDDMETTAKIHTLTMTWLAEMPRQVREMQILERESGGWKNLALGRERQLKKNKVPVQNTIAIQCGFAMLKQAAEARETHEEVYIPRGFKRWNK